MRTKEIKEIWKILKENKEVIALVMILGGMFGLYGRVLESIILISAGVTSVIVYSVVSRKIGIFATTMTFIVFLMIFTVVLRTTYDRIDYRLAVSLLLSLYLIMIVIFVIRLKEEIVQVREKRRQKITNNG